MTFMDGNALAGPLRELFAMDVTGADGQCATCGLAGPVASMRVYGVDTGPGLVGRCPGCGSVMMRLVRSPNAAWLDMRGVVSLRIPMNEPMNMP
jgi:hypothetical protein